MGDLRRDEDEENWDTVDVPPPVEKLRPVLPEVSDMWELATRYGHGPWTEAAKEMRLHVAKFFYDRMEYDGLGKKPEITTHSNGIKQSEAFREADRFMEHLFEGCYWIRAQ